MREINKTIEEIIDKKGKKIEDKIIVGGEKARKVENIEREAGVVLQKVIKRKNTRSITRNIEEIVAIVGVHLGKLKIEKSITIDD